MLFNKSIIYKLALPVPVIILFCLVVAWVTIPKVVSDNAIDAATQSALQTAKQFKIIRSYYTKNIIKKAKANGTLIPSIDHVGKPNAIPLPATLIHDLSKLLAKENTTMTLYSPFPFPNRRERVLDDFKKSAWDYLNKYPDQVFKQKETRGDKTFIRVAIADKMEAKGCVTCHNIFPQTPKNDWRLGDVRGVLEIDADITGSLLAASEVKNDILIGIFFAGLAVLGIVIAGARAISNPIKRITQVMSEISQGRLEATVPHLDRKDEVGHMAQALAVFKDNALRNQQLEAEQAEQKKQKKAELAKQKALDEVTTAERKFVAKSFGKAMSAIAMKDLSYRITEEFPATDQQLKNDFNNAIEQLSSTIDQIGIASAQILSGSSELHTSASGLSRRTEQQAATIEETAAALEETTTAMKASTERAGDAAHLVAATKDDAVNSGNIVQNAISAMGEIEASSVKIASIIRVIDDIAFQTNLLALNAGVEAARAGESGRGFAVVAQEVRELAQRSASAAKEIKTLIKASEENVKVGGSLVNETGAALGMIVSKVAEVNEHVAAIVTSASEQSIGLQEINQSVNSIDQGTQQNAAAAEQSTAASYQLKEEVQKIDRMLKEFNTGRAGRAAMPAVASEQNIPQPSSARTLTRKVANSFSSNAVASNEDSWECF